MGQIISASSPEARIKPDCTKEPSFDPLYGFPNGRKPRVCTVTEEEMVSAGMPWANRDYCAPVMLEYYKCRQRVFPLIYRCHHERHDVFHCQYEDFVLRMKEHEREKRLLQREKRKERLNI